MIEIISFERSLMLSFGFISAILIEILFPFALGIWFVRKFGASWKIFGVGVLTFIASQIIHLPLLFGWDYAVPRLAASLPSTVMAIINAVVLGLAAGICEETARWVGFKLLKSRAKSVGSGLMAGAGHGGVESIIIGLMVLVNYVLFMIISSGKGDQFGLPMEMQMSMAQQMYAYISMPWYMPLIGAVERIFALALHLTLSIMVWQAFKNRSWGWFIGAVLWHTFVDGAAVIMSTYQFNLWLIEGVIGLMAASNIVFLVWFTRRQVEIEAEEAEEEAEQALLDGQVSERTPDPEEQNPADELESSEKSKAAKKPRAAKKAEVADNPAADENDKPAATL
ncbi:MAG: YhfC family intramembrane metalloprotease [Anaerolineaceae bacterium]